MKINYQILYSDKAKKIIAVIIILIAIWLNFIRSDEEILSSRIAEYKMTIEDKEKTIESLRKEINTIDKPYYNCYKTQLLRLADWIEYNIDYCKDNLKSFEQGLK